MDMNKKPNRIGLLTLILLLALGAGCTTSQAVEISPIPTETARPVQTEIIQIAPETATPVPSPTTSPSPTATEIVFSFGKELTIDYLRELEILGSEITLEERISPGYNYQRYLASYLSQGNKIYGLLTIPFGDPPPAGFKAVVFNHGYIPPEEYQTLERYTAYVDYLARSGFVVFKIDYRGHGRSEGYPSGSYFSPGYTIDAISALKSLQTLDEVDPEGIGVWGHSMAGNLVLRAMLVEPEIKAGVIFAGAVYSYEDFLTYGISDNTYRPPATEENLPDKEILTSSRILFETYGWPDLDTPYWQAVSLTENLSYLESPIQIHHAENDPVVNIGYSYALAEQLQALHKPYEFYIYEGGGHNIISPYFDQAMLRTIQFFKDNL